MKERLTHLIEQINKELGLFMGIGLGVFLFVLIFKPFPLDHIEFDEQKLFVLGLGALVLLILFIVRIVYPCLMENNYQHENETALHSFLTGLIIWLFKCCFIFCLSEFRRICKSLLLSCV